MMIYKGKDLYHWREPFQGDECVQVFLHYSDIKSKAAKPNISAEQLQKAREYMLAGGDIKAIESKYKLTAVYKKELNEQSKDTQEA